MNHILDWRDHAGASLEKFYKTTLWQGDQMMVGLNCLEPGQIQPPHTHDAAEKFYFVLEGSGRFTVGDQEIDAGEGALIVAPAGIQHGVTNNGNERLSLLVVMSPPPVK
jgi:quercetin dioxygenase-like cupin family protein